MPATNTTVKEAISNAVTILTPLQGAARLEAELLLAHALDRPRTYLHTWPERKLDDDQKRSFKTLIQQRVNGVPIAYLIGTKEFWSMCLAVTPDTLIPRPETEHVVELALDKIPVHGSYDIADLGTGSGAIALAIAKERPRCQVVATDTSAAALEVARHNATKHQLVNLSFRHGDWLKAVANKKFHVIVSNPPYVSPKDPYLRQGDLRFEPPKALAAQDDGMADLTSIAAQARRHLYRGGWLMLEHGFNQGPAVTRLLNETGYRDITDNTDSAGIPRVVVGRFG